MPDDDSRLELVIRLTQAQIAAQVASAVGIDGRSVGVLAFDGALIAGVIAAKDPLGSSWQVLLIGLIVSAVLSLGASFRDLRAGPDFPGFYREISAETAELAKERAVKDLIDAIAKNRTIVRSKEGFLAAAVIGLVVTPMDYGLYRGGMPGAALVISAAVVIIFVVLRWLSAPEPEPEG